MGGGAPAGGSKSIADTLHSDAKTRLEELGMAVPPGGWDESVKLLAKIYFQRDWGYTFDNGQPKQLAPGKTPERLIEFCSADATDMSCVDTYIENLFGRVQTVPKKMKADAARDFATVPNILLNRPGTDKNKWYTYKYTNTFQRDEDSDALIGNNTAVRVDATIVYCNAERTADGKKKQFLIIYYAAVYYEISSETEKKRASFMSDAFALAKGFASARFPPRNEEELKKILQSYCRDSFLKNFGYQYDDVPTNAIDKHGIERPTLWTSSYLARFSQEEWVERLAPSFCQNLSNSVPKSVQDVLTKQLKTLVSGSSVARDKTWTSLKLVVTPTDDHASAFDGFVYYFTEQGTTNQERDIALTYVLIMGVFYKTKPPGETDLGNLFEQLISELPEQRPVTLGPGLNRRLQPTLEKFALDNAKILFTRRFGFDWDMNPRLPRSAKGEKFCRAFEKFFDLNDEPSVTNIERQVSTFLEPEDYLGRVGPLGVEKLFDALVRKIEESANMVRSPTEENHWQVQYLDKLYDDSKSHILRHYAVFLFVYGVRGKTRQFFLQYLGVITERDVS